MPLRKTLAAFGDTSSATFGCSAIPPAQAMGQGGYPFSVEEAQGYVGGSVSAAPLQPEPWLVLRD